MVLILTHIKKRDNRVVLFNPDKITNAIFKAAESVGGSDRELAKKLSAQVLQLLEQKFDNSAPSVEDIQDTVEKVLIEEGHAKTAKAFILYRAQHSKIRKAEATFMDIDDTMMGYLKRADWRVNENSNVDYSVGGLILYVSGKVTANYWLNHIYPPYIGEAHKEGDLHLHDLSMFTAYCAGWSLRQLLKEGFGGVPGRVQTLPAKHLSTVIGQMVNFLGTLQNEWAGAQAFSSVDTYLAPFVHYDNLSYKEVKQQIQRLLFNLATPSRWGTQCVPTDTEALTDKGWKKHHEIKNTDKIATFNIKTKKIEFLKPLRVTAYDFDGKLVRLKNRTQDQLVTPDHKVVRKVFNTSRYELIEAQALFKYKTPVLVPTAAQTSSKKKFDKNWIELFAWLVSEGSFADGSRKRVYLFQSQKNKEKCNEIRKILKSLKFTWDESLKTGGFSINKTVRFRLNQESSRKVRKYLTSKKVPDMIKTLSPDLIKLFIDTYVKGDGHKEAKGRIRIYTKDRDVLDSLQELCSLCDYGSTAIKRASGVYTLNIIRNQIASITSLSWKRYKGKVWCPTTKNGTFIARRKDKVFITGNTPFTNFTFDWVVPEDMKDLPVLVGGKLRLEKYRDFQKEMDMINRAFIECMTEGDASGRIFTYPIPTYNITKDFDWDSENANLLFDMTAKYGTPYFQNFINSSLNPSDVRSMCCRLQLNLAELRSKTGGLFGSGENTGSVGVVTLNLPRVGYLAKDDTDFFERLGRLMDIARDSLEIKREVITKYMDTGLLPYTKRYLGNLNQHFSTVGLNGMNECCLNFVGKDITAVEGKTFALRVLDFMRDRLKEYQEDTGHIYNLEATPAEGTSYRLALTDKKRYPDIIQAGDDEPYYTNSSQLPVGHTEDIFEALAHQDELQAKYTGGTVLHGFLGEKINDVEACKKLVRRIAYNFKLPYFTITPTFSVCANHGYLTGEQHACPNCGKATEVYTRVVGFHRPITFWNKGKKEEFKERKVFNVEKSMSNQVYYDKYQEATNQGFSKDIID